MRAVGSAWAGPISLATTVNALQSRSLARRSRRDWHAWRVLRTLGVLRVLRVSCAVAALVVAGCAAVLPLAPEPEPGPAPTVATSAWPVGDATHAVRWTLPAGELRALVLLQHGFTRDCGRLDGTARALAREGLLVLCVEASMAFGQPVLAPSLAEALAAQTLVPPAAPLPRRIVVGGHSAGAVFAARVGARLAEIAPERLAGALLLDPVAAGGFEGDLQAIADGARRGVVAIAAAPGPCNARQNARPALERLARSIAAAGGDGFVGVELAHGSTHVDAEGEDTSAAAIAACAQGAPTAANVRALRRLAARWGLQLAAGAGASARLGEEPFVHRLVEQGAARPLARDPAAP